MVNEFLQYLQYEKNFSSHTVLSYRTDLYQFCAFLSVSPDNFTPSLVDGAIIRQWSLDLINAGVSARTIARKISSLKSFWRYLLKRGLARTNPTLKFILPKTNKLLPVFFKQKELDAVLDDRFLVEDFETIRNDLIIRFFYLTGMRLSELKGLCDEDVDFSACTVRVLGKRNKERLIPLDEEFIRYVKHYIALRNSQVPRECNFLFVRVNGKGVYAKLLYTIVSDKMSEVTSQKKKSPHVLRHTFATAMLNGGADINVVKELLGHASLAATQVYTHTNFDELYKIYERAHPRAK